MMNAEAKQKKGEDSEKLDIDVGLQPYGIF